MRWHVLVMGCRTACQHSLGFDAALARPGMGWLAAVGRGRMRILAASELLGAIGLIVPALTGILTWLTPVAGAALALLMAAGAVFHARRVGEAQNVAFNLMLGAVATLVASWRFVVAPF